MGFWHRVRDFFGLSNGDFVVEGDRVVFRNLERAKEVPLEPNPGPANVPACGKCEGDLLRVVFTTAGSGQEALWRAHPLAVDGWLCPRCGWSVMPRHLTTEEVIAFERKVGEHAAAGQLDDAEFWTRRVLASWRGYPIALANLGALYAMRAQHAPDRATREQLRSDADGYLRRALLDEKLRPDHAVLELARLEVLDGREPAAKVRLHALVDDPKASDAARAEARQLLADLAEGKGLYTRASELVNPYMILADRGAPALGDAAHADLAEARELLLDAIDRSPAFAPYWLLGKLEQVLGRSQAALDAFARAIEIEPDQPNGLREYVLACLAVGRAEDAIEPARRAVRAAPEDAGLRSNLALVLLLAGEVDDALETIEKAQRDDPEDRITKALAARIREVKSGRRARPRTLAELEGRA